MCSEGRKSTEIYAFVEETLEERRERTMYTNVCKHCHQVFRSKIRTCCCKDCRDKDEDQLDDIVEYLHRFPNSNALQISCLLYTSTVVASFKNDNNKYYRNACYGYSYSNGDTDSYGNAKMKSGDYNMIVYPSVRYNFYASKNDVRHTVSSKHVGKNGATVNFKLALYKVCLLYTSRCV